MLGGLAWSSGRAKLDSHRDRSRLLRLTRGSLGRHRHCRVGWLRNPLLFCIARLRWVPRLHHSGRVCPRRRCLRGPPVESGSRVPHSLLRGPWSLLTPRLDRGRGRCPGAARPLVTAHREPGTSCRATQEVAGRVLPMGDSSRVMGHTRESSLGMVLPTSSQPYRRCAFTVPVLVSYAFGGRPHFRMRLCLLSY